jgi:phage repressor protein C with HTH and peptisase S24 domain
MEQFLLLVKLYGVRDILSVFYSIPARNAYAKLNERGVEKAKEYIALLAQSDLFIKQKNVSENRRTRTIPLYDIPVSAGTGMFLDSDQYELIEVDDTVPSAATFAVTVSGDSMEPEFEDRQIIYVRQQITIEPGEVGIFMLNGDVYCKQAADGSLVSFNPSYRPIRIGEYDDFRIIGKVVG